VTGIPDSLLPILQLGAMGLLGLGVIWVFLKGIPLYLETEKRRAELRKETAQINADVIRELREYHRQDSELLRKCIDGWASSQRDAMAKMTEGIGAQVAGLARAVERNTIALVASAEGGSPRVALQNYTNGGPGA